MEEFFRFLATYEVYIYFFLGIGLIFTLRWLVRAYQEWREAYFGLERQLASRHLSKAVAATFLIGMLFISQLCIASFVVPGLPATTFLFTPTAELLRTPAVTIAPGTATAIAQTPDAVLPFGAVGCIPEQIVITSPQPGESVSKIVEITGTVNVPNFGFYKYEVAQQGSENWATIAASRDAKRNQPLGAWDTSTLTPGDYQLRLIVTDNEGQEYPPCIIPVRVTGSQ